MMNSTTEGLVQIWVSVVDGSGREHLEAHWVSPVPHLPVETPTHVHAA